MRYIITGCIIILAIFSFIIPQEYIIKGKVTDASTGHPVAGASVMVKGTNNSTITDTAGVFSLMVKSQHVTIVIASVGYSNREIKASAGGEVNISLAASNHKLEEVVVVGYGAQLKGKAGGIRTRAKGQHDMATAAPEYQMADQSWRYNNNFNREGYDGIVENRFLQAINTPLSTFSIDVDAASYSNVRRILNSGNLPPAGAVRIEEMINYFTYDYPQPTAEHPFSINTEISACPWNNQHKLVSIGLQGKKISTERLPPANLVFLIDVSGSMMDPNKLPLVKQSMKLLADNIRDEDKVAIVVYAGNAGLVLPSTSGEDRQTIIDAIERLEAGGSTAGGAGIKLAYKVAKKNFLQEGNNRVILCTDGDFNVGASSDAELEEMIEEERKSGVFLTVLGFGTGNYQDAKMQKLADKGNGNHSYIDNFLEAKKVLVNEFGGTLFTIAKDVKLQIEFNPNKVAAYRLVGYENRLLNKEDFNNDKKDAGELGSGHTVTALYEIIPVGVKSDFIESVDKLKYQQEINSSKTSEEVMTIKFRYKKPNEDNSRLIVHPVIDKSVPVSNTSDNFRFAAAVAEFGMVLRKSEFRQSSNYEHAWKLAKGSMGEDPEGYRSEFLKMIKNAESLTRKGF